MVLFPRGEKNKNNWLIKNRNTSNPQSGRNALGGETKSAREEADGRIQEGLEGTGGGKGTRARQRQPCEESAAALINSHASCIIRLQSSDYDLQRQQQQQKQTAWLLWTN